MGALHSQRWCQVMRHTGCEAVERPSCCHSCKLAWQELNLGSSFLQHRELCCRNNIRATVAHSHCLILEMASHEMLEPLLSAAILST